MVGSTVESETRGERASGSPVRSPAESGVAAPTENPGGNGHTGYLGSLGFTGSATISARRQREEATVLAEDQDVQETAAHTDDDVDELLVEEISIDGMCGVY